METNFLNATTPALPSKNRKIAFIELAQPSLGAGEFCEMSCYSAIPFRLQYC